MPYQLALLLLSVSLVVIAMRAGSLGLRTRPEEPHTLAEVRSVRRFFVLLLGLGLGVAVWEWLSSHDWLHSAWIWQGCLIVGFLGSGVWLAESAAIETDSPGDERPVELHQVAWVLPLFLLLVAILVPTLMSSSPRADQAARGNLSHWPVLLELAKFGLGGPQPDFLEPKSELELARGLAYLPRALSVSAGVVNCAAVLAIAYGLLRLIAGRLKETRQRAGFRLLGPWILWMALIVISGPPGGALDPGLLLPGGIEQSGLWESAPSSLRAFGPVLALGAISVVLSAFPTRRGPASPRS